MQTRFVPRLTVLLLIYGLLNAAAYCMLLPLWAGFDEPYHYGYVQYLSMRFKFPVLHQAPLSREIWHSMELTPLSHFLQPSTGAPMNFGGYFALPAEERARLRRQLDSLPAEERYQPQPDKHNHEMNQSPAPYVALAVADRLLAGFPLTTRILWLRLLLALAAVALLWHGALLLSRQLELDERHVAPLLFCVFSSQMLYGTICHIANDALAVPVFCYLVWAAIRVYQRGTERNCLWLGLAVAAGLLIKAYYLALVPLALGVLGWGLFRRRIRFGSLAAFAAPVVLLAGPWYQRNLDLYDSLSATVEQTKSVASSKLLDGVLSLPWLESILDLARSSLWTGNNSFTTFSHKALDLTLLLLAAALVLYFRRLPKTPAERITLAAIVFYCASLAFVTVTFFVGTHGLVYAAMPWYTQLLLAPVLLLAFLGMARTPRWGDVLARLTVLMWGYLMVASYLAKLVPMYAGFSRPQAHLADLWAWYRTAGAQRNDILRSLSLVSPGVLWTFIAATLALGVALMFWLACRPAETQAVSVTHRCSVIAVL